MTCGVGGKIINSWHYTAEEAHKAWQVEKIKQIRITVFDYISSENGLTEIAEALLKRVDILENHISLSLETKTL